MTFLAMKEGDEFWNAEMHRVRELLSFLGRQNGSRMSDPGASREDSGRGRQQVPRSGRDEGCSMDCNCCRGASASRFLLVFLQ